MHPNIKLNPGTLYISDGQEYKEIAITSGYLEPQQSKEVINDIDIKSNFYGEATLTIRPTYKKWFKKKKGKRYLHYYIIKNGFDPKLIQKLRGDCNE